MGAWIDRCRMCSAVADDAGDGASHQNTNGFGHDIEPCRTSYTARKGTYGDPAGLGNLIQIGP